MSNKVHFFTANDLDRIKGFLKLATASRTERYQYLLRLKEELVDAVVVAPEDIPPDIVTMNSKVRFKDLTTGKSMTVTLVLPEEADFDEKKISLLAPLGVALLGCKAGEAVNYEAPGGIVKIAIEEILYQPEAAGEFLL